MASQLSVVCVFISFALVVVVVVLVVAGGGGGLFLEYYLATAVWCQL